MKRRTLVRSGIIVLFVLGCAGLLCIASLARIFPVNFSSPQLAAGQPLGAGEALAFSYMRVDLLRPFALYTFDDAQGFRSFSEGLVGSDTGPAWSPDGTQLAYQSVSGWETRHFLVAADGGNRRELTADDSYKVRLQWSPDGTRLAYLAYSQLPEGTVSNSAELSITDVPAGTTHQAPAGDIRDVVWTPDGAGLLAIVRAEGQATFEIYGADGRHVQRLSQADFLREAVAVSLSPDAGRVAYIIPGEEEAAETLFISALDGSGTVSAPARWLDGSLAWSPGGARLAFVALTDVYEYALYVMDAGSGAVRELMLLNTGDDSGEILPAAPAWAPDGARLAISSYDHADGASVYVLDPDGTGRREIITTGSGGMIYDLAWRPGQD